jgi:hypothetical protein
MNTQRIEQRQIIVMVMVFLILVLSIISFIVSGVAFNKARELQYKFDQLYYPAKELIQEAEEGLVDLANEKIRCETDLSICRENLNG